MITLKTLPQATEQEVFDQVTKHLLEQNKKSMKRIDGKDTCSYRGDDGLKCAAGCLIADDEYNPKIENCSWDCLEERGGIPAEHARLIELLQHIHDSKDVGRWRGLLRALCEEEQLTWNFQ